MEDSTIRLNKYLANIGVCARRDVQSILLENDVTVNGVRATEPGMRIDPAIDEIYFNGKTLQTPKLVYYLINKPWGIISTTEDEYQRKNVTSFIKTPERIYPVGRLDKETTGLLILTNDGDLTNILTHPKYHIDKVYRLKVQGLPSSAQVQKLRTGIRLEDGMTSPATVTVVRKHPESSSIEMTIHEGRNRQIRRMCLAVGLKLISLQRVKIGPIEIGNLADGKYRQLTQKEVQTLKSLR